MRTFTYNSSVDLRPATSALHVYAKHWGPIEWRSKIMGKTIQVESGLAEVIQALGAIETDSRIVARKVRASRIDRVDVLHEFLIIWQAEESEHGRALNALASCCGARTEPPSRRTIGAMNALVLPILGRIIPQVMRAAYCTQGAVQEFIALQSYKFAAGLIGDADAAEILRAIARQEARHMRFYLLCANAYLTGRPLRQRFVRAILTHLWAPPGVDLLGSAEFVRIARPLLRQPEYRRLLLEVDQFCAKIPGMAGAMLMQNWFRQQGVYDL